MNKGRRALGWLVLGVGLGLTSGAAALGAPPSDATRYVAMRSFRVPVDIRPADLPRLKKLTLSASTDRGATWTAIRATTPDRPFFAYSSATDGEVWFAAQATDRQGRPFPDDGAPITANMKVVIDTKKPDLRFLTQVHRGTSASLSWEVKDENLDLDSLAFDFLKAGSTTWTPLPLNRPSLLGKESWDVGTAEPVQVRGVIADRAGNRRVVTVNLDSGAPGADALNVVVDTPGSSDPPPLGTTFASSEATRPVSTGPGGARSDPTTNAGSAEGGAISAVDPWSDPQNQRTSGTRGGFAADADVTVLPPVSSPKFSLAYAVDDAGPNGAAVVELYTTRDGGRTWEPRGPDPDRVTPFDVDLGGQGRFGLKLVARSAADQGDRPPTPGEAPRVVVDVDSTGPVVNLNRPQVEGNILVVTWRSEDAHPSPPGARSVMVSVRADAPDARWQPITLAAIEDNGQFRWQIPPRCPAKIQVRVDIRDALNNLGFAETPTDSPVVVDLSKPRSRILGVDRPSLRR